MTDQETLLSVFCTLWQGLDDDILEASFGRWADAAASYCLGMPPQIVLKSMTKHRDRVEKTLCKKSVPDLGECEDAEQEKEQRRGTASARI